MYLHSPLQPGTVDKDTDNPGYILIGIFNLNFLNNFLFFLNL